MPHRPVSRRNLLAKGAAVGALVAAGPARIAKGAETTTTAAKARFTFCLNTSTIRGHHLGIEGELDLAAKAGYGTPQRVSTGFDGRRLALLLAVLDKRAGLSFSQLDVFLNVVGGVRMQEPAGDLAVASALAPEVSLMVAASHGFGLRRRGVQRRSQRP